MIPFSMTAHKQHFVHGVDWSCRIESVHLESELLPLSKFRCDALGHWVGAVD